jgi:1,4-alpha-glucan branching enzyme
MEIMTSEVEAGTKAIEQLSLDYITSETPMGGNLLPSAMGATFKLWAPAARKVELLWQYKKDKNNQWVAQQRATLNRLGDIWAGFVPRLTSGTRYMFYVVGPEGGTEGLKRDPFARDLTDDPMWPECQCLLVSPSAFPWHDAAWKPPAFNDLSIYQLHIGTWRIPQGRHHSTFLDIIDNLPYLKSLNINAIQPLPIVEFPTMFSLGYNGVDYFSPETDYGIRDDDPELPNYLKRINEELKSIDPSCVPYELHDIQGTANQFKMMVDMCHAFDIAVLMDVVYNHAGGDFGDKSIYFLDREPYGNQNNSQYFTDHEWAGGLVFAYWKNEVKQFLIDNALYYLQECHCDGFRYDEVSVIKNEGGEHGWLFCQYVTDTSHYVKPDAIHIAECWPVQQAIVSPTNQGGAGFDASQNDGLRDSVRNAVQQASWGAGAFVDMSRIAQNIKSQALYDGWRAVQCVENHDIVYKGRSLRIAALADGNDHHSWYARSRARVATGLTATAMGIAHLFMGQEILEDKSWSDNPDDPLQIWWDGLQQQDDPSMRDFLSFTQALFEARNQQPALRATGLNIFHVHNDNRILAYHRWVEGQGRDVVVIASLNDSTYWNYQLGFPIEGQWREVFNSDYYDNCPNPNVAGNGGNATAYGQPMHGLPHSAQIVIPANGILIFAK